jgi:hypothetical protein
VRGAVGFAVEGENIFMCALHISGGRKIFECGVEVGSKEVRTIGVKRPLGVGITGWNHGLDKQGEKR